jgi:hypothetical protein
MFTRQLVTDLGHPLIPFQQDGSAVIVLGRNITPIAAFRNREMSEFGHLLSVN